MSLLMEALRRPPAAAPAPEPLALAPRADAAAPPPTGLPDLAQHLDAVNADLAASLESPSAPRPPQAEARAAFAARAAGPLAQAPSPRLWLGLAGLILLLGGGAYFAWEWQRFADGGLTPTPALGSAPPAPLAAPAAPPLASATPGHAEPATVDSQDIRRAMQNQRLTHASTAPAAPATPAPPRLDVQRNALALDPALTAAHAALEQGNLAQAQRDFAQALERDPHNLDALLGLAALALGAGRQAEALAHYQAALTAHPRDARALAGYLGLNAARDPEGTESRLKILLHEQADAPALHFALGNLLAGQSRWHEAQAAYFQAWSLDASNPDYRFNLAVSLDRLHQSRLAAEHYQAALAAARLRPAAFDPEQVRARLAQLEGSAAP